MTQSAMLLSLGQNIKYIVYISKCPLNRLLLKRCVHGGHAAYLGAPSNVCTSFKKTREKPDLCPLAAPEFLTT